MSFRRSLAKADRISREAKSATDPKHLQAAKIVVKAAREAGDKALRSLQEGQ